MNQDGTQLEGSRKWRVFYTRSRAEKQCEEHLAQQDPARLRLVEGPLLLLGQTVNITDGLLRGLCGEVAERRGQYHVILRITAIRQAVRVHVPAAWVRRDNPALS